MGHYELISACFFGKLALKKHTPKFADPSPPIVHTCCEIFLLFFGGFPYEIDFKQFPVIIFGFYDKIFSDSDKKVFPNVLLSKFIHLCLDDKR